MLTETHTGLESPKGVWWKPAHKSERTWVAIAFGWCMVLFAMMPLWQVKGDRMVLLKDRRGRERCGTLHCIGCDCLCTSSENRTCAGRETGE